MFPVAGRKMDTFRSMTAFIIPVMRDQKAMAADFFGDSGWISGKSPGNLRKRGSFVDHDFNLCAFREGKMFKAASMLNCHNNLQSAPGL